MSRAAGHEIALQRFVRPSVGPFLGDASVFIRDHPFQKPILGFAMFVHQPNVEAVPSGCLGLDILNKFIKLVEHHPIWRGGATKEPVFDNDRTTILYGVANGLEILWGSDLAAGDGPAVRGGARPCFDSDLLHISWPNVCADDFGA